MKAAIERLLERIEPDTNGGCWLWSGATTGGYATLGIGTIAVGDRGLIRGHRLSYEHFVGAVPAGMVVRHKCDVKACVNPDHLIVGTQKDNGQDAMERGRMRVGSARKNAKYSEADAVEMRRRYALGEPQESIATAYGIHQSAVSRPVNKKSWTHV